MAPAREIQAISWAVIDAKFRHAAAHRLDVAGIASGKPIEVGSDAHASIVVAQAFKPRVEDGRLTNFNHIQNVSYRIQTENDNNVPNRGSGKGRE